MSGGVDSSVAAFLMKEAGYDCRGATMRLYRAPAFQAHSPKSCCSDRDEEDAAYICYQLGIPHEAICCTKSFEQQVIRKFVREYEEGRTPNPCIDCNRYLKFDSLYRRAMELGCEKIVTGHYARIAKENGKYVLKKALNPEKDQSYVLYNLDQELLAHTLFPLGEMTKDQTRAVAEENGFINAAKPESQDICFVPDGDYAAMIKRYRGKDYPKGNFVDTDGNVLGQHNGIIGYTIGQRRGLGIPDKKRLYVTKLDVDNNQVILGDNEDLFKREVNIRDFHWITGDAPKDEFRCNAKIRYRHKEQPGVCIINSDGTAVFTFDEPQRAITPGQSAVLYDGDYVLGGGIISNK